jgi:hypothetical protein
VTEVDPAEMNEYRRGAEERHGNLPVPPAQAPCQEDQHQQRQYRPNHRRQPNRCVPDPQYGNHRGSGVKGQRSKVGVLEVMVEERRPKVGQAIPEQFARFQTDLGFVAEEPDRVAADVAEKDPAQDCRHRTYRQPVSNLTRNP